MSDTASTRKQLKIKVGVVKRYRKELALYRAEVVQNETKLESIRASGEGTESWDVKNVTNLVRESEKMVLDTTTRLDRATGELEDLLKSAKRNAKLEQDPELREVEAVLAAASPAGWEIGGSPVA